MPFKPGESGNPSGASNKEKPFYTALHRAITQDDGKRLRACAERLLDLAAEGEAWAVKELADHIDGKPAQAVHIGGDPDPNVPPVAVKATVEFVNAAPVEPSN